MIHLAGSVDLAAPVDDVFKWLDEPERVAAMNPLLTTILESQRLPNGGLSALTDSAQLRS